MFTTQTTADTTAAQRTVRTTDGIALAVSEYGNPAGALTVVFLHGHCLRSESWSFVRDELISRYAGARILCFDHRGHGDSAVAAAATYTIEQLANDLHDVLDEVAGPIVLIGHSMGGMTALTYAALYPHEIGTRIVGFGLIATAASGLAEAGFGRFLRNPAVSMFQAGVRRAPELMQSAKRLACKVFAPVVRAAEFGDRTVSPRVLTLAYAMHNETPIVTMASFLSSFMTYDRSAVLSSLSAIPTLVLCGSADLMTPPSHSVAMAAGIEYADFVMIDGAGHSVIMEQPAEVAEAVTRLLDRAAGTPSIVDELVLVA
ncbi:alpha/beta fold hydrolase [Antrihabitans cavernicola]|uniref:Alpha/beta hydrolase n=1 Tax=Antrihabitans cavernicola TaxID=2495913 RepID=A0A5A7SB23_9NOCA|nr:alpha/beta hydrolase [Spelaeibacter cavernicola]KAA0022047.1 alpha/beta hydrolase [Spelaeibacter cavernicola]